MPRNGDGSSDNAIEAGETLAHGVPAGSEGTTSQGVDRSNKAAPAPEPDAGAGVKIVDGQVKDTTELKPGEGEGIGQAKIK